MGKEEEKMEDKNKMGEKTREKNEGDISIVTEENVSQSLNQRIDSTPKTFNEDRPKYVLLEKTKALYTLMHPYLELFPKSEKFTLRQKMEDSILECIKILIIQNYKQTDEERKGMVLEFLANVYVLETLIQQALVFKYIAYAGHGKIMPLVREINAYALARYKNLNKSQMEAK